MSQRYGRRSWSLWGKRVHWADCKEALASIRRVAKDVIDRTEAEFNSEDLYLAYEAFDLDAWAKVFRASTPGAPGRMRLDAATRKLCVALGIAQDMSAWHSAAKIALAHKTQLVEKNSAASASTSGPDVDNRLAWRSAVGSKSFPRALIDATLFYLATWDGTGAVERGLGQDAAIQKQHVGRRAQECQDADLYSGLLEMHLDGPQTEETMFKSSAGVLLLTDFSRSCAQQWLCQHGRRFSCYKVRADIGRKTSTRRRGTDKAVQLLARAAYASQREMAKDDVASAPTSGGQARRRPTVLGVERLKLMATVSRLAKPLEGKKTRRFRDATAKKLAEKKAAGTWCGWSDTVPKPRLGGATALEATTRSAATQAVRAKLWLSAKARLQTRASTPAPSASRAASSSSGRTHAERPGVEGAGGWKRRAHSQATAAPAKSARRTCSSSTSAKGAAASASTPGTPSPSMYKALASKLAQRRAQHNIDQSLESMIRKRITDPSTTTLLSWLKAISIGGTVSCESQKIFLQQACVGPSLSLSLSAEFEGRHKPLAQALRAAAASSKGRWTCNKTGKSAQKAHDISRKRDVVNFLLQARRVALSDAPSALVRSF